MASIVDQWIEEDYFTSLMITLDNMDERPENIEETVHTIMDAHTHDGVLDTDALDTYIDKLIGV